MYLLHLRLLASRSARQRLSGWFLTAALFSWATVGAFAQAAGTGTITGRVFNPATGDYVRNAEVRLQGTNRVVATEGDGSFRLDDVPAGSATLTVVFSGYTTATETIAVAPGQTATREISLTSTLAGQSGALQMSQFVVSSEREGNAKAIMEQRRNMNIATSVASDVFGDVAEGNVGEFLKYLPGVELDYVEGVARGPRLGGLDAQYTSLTIDGANLASADAFTAFGEASRSVSFEQMSINSVESIEISRTSSADMDANAPGGRVNLKTKRAFDLKGRRITWQVSAAANSEEFTLSKTYGPQHTRRHHIRPNYIFGYSDTFFKQRLGLSFNVSSAEQYSEQYRVAMNYNTTPITTGANPDPRPLVLQQITFKDGPRQVDTFSTSMTADFKASKELVLSLTAMHNAYLNNADARLVQYNFSTNNTNATTGRGTVLGDGLTNVRTSDGAAANTGHTVNIPGSGAQKLTNTITFLPGFEYKRGRLTVEGKGTYSKSKNDYENIVRGIARSATVNPLVANFSATRPDAQSHEWSITQVSGPDWSNLANYANPRVTEEGRFALTEIYAGQLDATYVTPLRLPTYFKFGGKFKEEDRILENRTALYNWSYIGPGGNTLTGYNPTTGAPILTSTGSWAGFRSPHAFDMGTTNGLSVANMPPVVNLNSLAALVKSNPEQFVNVATPADYYTAMVANERDLSETIDAGYGMANTRVGQWQFQGGLRWERTVTESKEVDPVAGSAVRAAGYTVDNTGRATTIEGLNYQYFSQPRVTRRGEYDHFFPSVSAKYSILPNVIAQAGYSYTISRAPVTALSGSWAINETTRVITAPNPELKPELSDNYMARVAWYFEPVGSLSVMVSQNEVSNFRQTRRVPASEAGFADDPEYADYEFSAPFNVAGLRRFRTMEVAYSQALSFLPSVLRGTNVNLSYTRTYANERRAGTSPHRITASLGYSFGRYSVRVGGVWTDDTPWTAVETRYRRQKITTDLSGGVQLTRRMSFFFQGRRIFNDPVEIFEGVDSMFDRPVLQTYENYGTNWVFGLKGTF